MFRYVGVDRNGIRRVCGQSENPTLAYVECQRAIADYVRRRPDTAPASAWLIEPIDSL